MNHAVEQKPKTPSKLVSGCYEWLSAAVAALVIISILFSCLFRLVNVDGDSMTNTLSHGDRMLLSTAFYEPAYGDVVVVRRHNDSPLIKRVIGLPGDSIRIDGVSGVVYRNGEALHEPYIKDGYTPQNGMTHTVIVEENMVFVMGDNRGGSLDSRVLGPLSMDDVVGKVFYRLSPNPGLVTNGE